MEKPNFEEITKEVEGISKNLTRFQEATDRGGPRNSDSRIRCKIYDQMKEGSPV